MRSVPRRSQMGSVTAASLHDNRCKGASAGSVRVAEDGRLLTNDLVDTRVRHTSGLTDSTQRLPVLNGGTDGGAPLLFREGAPLCGPPDAGEGIHLRANSLRESGDGVGAAPVVQRDRDALGAGFGAEPVVLAGLGDEAKRDLHGVLSGIHALRILSGVADVKA